MDRKDSRALDDGGVTSPRCHKGGRWALCCFLSTALLVVCCCCVVKFLRKQTTPQSKDTAVVWQLLSLQTLDVGAGRYTQARTFTQYANASTTTVVWNAVVPQPGLRLAQCHASSRKPRPDWFTPVHTVPHVDSDPRFIRMELTPDDGYPVLVHTAQQDTALALTYSNCQQLVEVDETGCHESFQTLLLIQNVTKTLYFDLQIGTGGMVSIVATISNPDGCQLVYFRVHLTHNQATLVENQTYASTPEPFRIDYDSFHPLPIFGLDNPVLAGNAVAYWDITQRRLLLYFDTTSSQHLQSFIVADNRTGMFGNPGAWTRMVAVHNSSQKNATVLVITFFDLEHHSLYLIRCYPEHKMCDSQPRLVDDQAYKGEFTDYGAGAFPDLQLSWDGCPVLVFFVQNRDDSSAPGCLRVLRCQDPICEAFRVQDAACGLAGYGRDASVTFPEPGLVVVSFLDLQAKDEPRYMKTRVAVFREATVP